MKVRFWFEYAKGGLNHTKQAKIEQAVINAEKRL